MKDYPPHPAAALFPMLDEDDLTALQNDISVDGQHEPIITWNGMIIDGRNRLAACQRINKKPRFKEMSFKSEAEVIAYIVSANLRRRHMTPSQLAMVSSELAKLEHGQRATPQKADASIKASAADSSGPVITQKQAAKLTGSSRASVQKARAVTKADPKLADEVKAGKVSLNKAYQQVKPKTEPKPKTIEPGHKHYIPPDPCEAEEPEPDEDDSIADDPPPFIPSADAVEAWRLIESLSGQDLAWIVAKVRGI